MTFRKAFLAAVVKSLLRGKSLIQAILSFWTSPFVSKQDNKTRVSTKAALRSIQDFLKEAEADLLGPTSGEGLSKLSAGLKKQFLKRLQTDSECMLPSYSHLLPTGIESGQFLALDVGGSTLRVAVVELSGSKDADKRSSEIVNMRNFKITKTIKDLEGASFFNWMAARINETLTDGLKKEHDPSHPLPMALAWSFPIEQTSLGGGKLGPMGKGFLAHEGLLGQDLGDIIKVACKNNGLNVEVEAILNDSTACLLSQAYTYPTTRLGLILGTGVNIAAYLPVHLIGASKFGKRPDSWYKEASHVIVNTELGMFGGGILPLTRWDQQLLDGHRRPEFQPLEHLVSGMYLGEIARFALIDAIESTGVFGGIVPPSLETPYALGTDLLSIAESDNSADLSTAIATFAERHPSSHTPTTEDLSVFKALGHFISVRSSAIVATCVYTLWDVRLEAQRTYIDSIPEDSPIRSSAEADMTLPKTMVSFNGSVIENYPGYLTSCQQYVDDLIEGKGDASLGGIDLVPAKESSLLGAAVASACVVRDA